MLWVKKHDSLFYEIAFQQSGVNNHKFWHGASAMTFDIAFDLTVCNHVSQPSGHLCNSITAASSSVPSQFSSTLTFRSPEMFDPELGDTTAKVDIWALGCTIVELGTGTVYPAKYSTASQIINRVASKKQGPDIPSSFPKDLQRILQRCFAIKHQERPSAKEVLQVPGGSQQDTVLVHQCYWHQKPYVLTLLQDARGFDLSVHADALPSDVVQRGACTQAAHATYL